MIDKRYGVVLRQIREQKQLSLSYFEKYGILKSNLARFERGEAMMGFERVATILQAMNVSLADYELFFNYYLPEYQEHFLVELEKASLFLDSEKCKKLFEEIQYSENRLLVLLAKAKITVLSASEVNEILDYLYRVHYWGYFEFMLTCDVVEYVSIEEIKKIVNIFSVKTNYFYDVMKYRRIIYQTAYKMVLELCMSREKNFAEELLNMTQQLVDERPDFYISVLRKMTIGCVIYCFESEEKGLSEIKYYLDLFEELGNKQLKQYYVKKINSIISGLE